jgi:hypothetical protein
VSPAVLRALRTAAARRIPTTLVFGREDTEWEEYTVARPVLARHGVTADRGLAVSLHDGVLHGFSSATAQAVMHEEVVSWLAEHAARAAGDPA